MTMTRFLGRLILLLLFFPHSSLMAQETGESSAPPHQDEFLAPEPWADRVRREGPVLELTLKDAIRLALTNNLDIAIEEFNEDLNRELIVGTKGFYDPTLSLNMGWVSQEQPSTTILDAGAGIPLRKSKRWSFDSSLTQNVAGGGNFSISFNNNRFTSNSFFVFVNPNFNSTFDLRFTQPLWRGFLETQTERQLKLFNLDTRITDSQFKQKVSEIVQQVETQYWELVYAMENHEIQRKSMELAIVQHRNNKRRVEIGVTAPIEITSSSAEVARSEQEMIGAEVAIISNQNGLKRMLAADPKASIWNLTLIPTDQPQMKTLQITLKQALETAIERRPELEQMRLQIDKNGVDQDYYKKEGKPSVNLVANVTSRGTAGQILQDVFVDNDGDGIPETRVGRAPNLNNPFFGAFGNSMGQAFGFDFVDYGVFLNVEIPLRNRRNDAQRAETGINHRRLLSQMKNQQQLIVVDVRNAYETIGTQKKRLNAARMARRLSEEQLEGETKRFQAGLSTNFEVLRYQRDLALSQVGELRALIDYQVALTSLQKAMYTIIDANDIALAKNNGK